MIELIENGVQLVVTGAYTAACFLFAYRYSDRLWDILALFYAAAFLGDLYWILYLFINHTTPNLSYISEFSWYAAYVFLLIVLRFVIKDMPRNRMHPLLLAVPVFVTAMCIFYMQWGDYLANVISAVLMGLLMWYSIGGLLGNKGTGADSAGGSSAMTRSGKAFCVAVLAFCLVEYGMWTVSCFWSGDSIYNPYLWFDIMFTMSMASFLPIFAKVVKA